MELTRDDAVTVRAWVFGAPFDHTETDRSKLRTGGYIPSRLLPTETRIAVEVRGAGQRREV
jgi:hypothetical protein